METFETVSTVDGFENFQATLYTDRRLFEHGGQVPFDTLEIGELGVDPRKPTNAQPGSEDKVRMLAARYAVGLPLWHDRDCYDHGEGSSDLASLDELSSGVSEKVEPRWSKGDLEPDEIEGAVD